MSTATASDEVRDRVARGAKLLDEKRPGWAAKVNIDQLAMSSCHACILGQVYGYFVNGLDALGLDDETYADAHHGFNIDDDEDMGDYAALASAWRAEVRSRTEVTS